MSISGPELQNTTDRVDGLGLEEKEEPPVSYSDAQGRNFKDLINQADSSEEDMPLDPEDQDIKDGVVLGEVPLGAYEALADLVSLVEMDDEEADGVLELSSLALQLLLNTEAVFENAEDLLRSEWIPDLQRIFQGGNEQAHYFAAGETSHSDIVSMVAWPETCKRTHGI